nr:hypothetical protein Q903MT_gene1660 [Picea sitchensis]
MLRNKQTDPLFLFCLRAHDRFGQDLALDKGNDSTYRKLAGNWKLDRAFM